MSQWPFSFPFCLKVLKEGWELVVDDVCSSCIQQSKWAYQLSLRMEFDSLKAARAFYSTYTECIDFHIRNKSFTSQVNEAIALCAQSRVVRQRTLFDLTQSSATSCPLRKVAMQCSRSTIVTMVDRLKVHAWPLPSTWYSPHSIMIYAEETCKETLRISGLTSSSTPSEWVRSW